MQPTQTFHEHVKELRLRLIYVFVSIAITGSVSYLVRNRVIAFIQKPLHSTLYFTSPAGSFNFVIKIATILGVFLALPVVVYNIVKFIEPALPKSLSGKSIFKVCLTSFILAIAGGAFGYYIIVPMSLHFFLSYSSATVRPLISATEYLSFIINVFITFALIFQIPLIVLFINHVKPLNPRSLLRYQRYIVVASLIIAVLLPFTYDPISQFVLALPILACFYLSVILVAIANRKKRSLSTTNVTVQPESVVEPEELFEEQPILTPQLALETVAESQATEIENKQKPRRSIYVDGFANSKPVSPLVGFKTFDILPVAEYRARNSITRTKKLSIDGFKFAS